jgi:hypothetical protein
VNGIRLSKSATNLKLDTEIAVKAQAEAHKAYVRGAEASSDPTRPAGCAQLNFHQTDPFRIQFLARTGDAQLAWKDGEKEYDATTGAAKSATFDSETKAYYYTRMIWKSAKTIGFGVEGSWVVAWVCGIELTASRRRMQELSADDLKTVT